MVIEQKWDSLRTLLRGMKCAVLAYSGGVDSSLLLRATAEVMGHRLIAVTAVSQTYPPGELEAAEEFARTLGVTHRILRTQELSSEDFTRNSPERCYFCKKELYGKLKKIAETEGISCILDGSNTDDLADYRPGRKAAVEFSVRSPLVETGLSKSDVRELARFLNLPMWNKPSLACLSSRIPYGTRITPDIIETVQTAEDHLRVLGFRQVRVRHHGKIARIEVERAAFGQVLTDDAVEKITTALKGLGYIYVCLDLEGYRTGSMNAAWDREQRTRAESRE